MLSAGTCVEWLRDDLASSTAPPTRPTVAGGCADTGDVWFVPALLGLGTPVWDFGARGTFIGSPGAADAPSWSGPSSRAWPTGAPTCSRRPRPTRACPSARSGSTAGCRPTRSSPRPWPTPAAGPVEIAPVLEATTLGAAYLAGMAVGTWSDEDDVAAAWSPRAGGRARPSTTTSGRRPAPRWLEARGRSEATIPELSALDF